MKSSSRLPMIDNTWNLYFLLTSSNKQNSTFVAGFNSNLPLLLLRACSRGKLWGEISTVAKRLLVIPATNALGKRSFPSLTHGTTYLSLTTGHSRLNHHMILQVHKDGTDALTLVDVANYFVGEKENQKQLFGKFFCEGYPKRVSYLGQSQHKRKIRDQNKRY